MLILGILVVILLFVIASIQWKQYILAKQQDIDAFNKKQKKDADFNFSVHGDK